ncbi:nucleoside hydrolase [Egibacter rhizosphaerae]|uniref:Nucleoside hydrolase n=1 Tax=Egibacter rhizosphaerae TaxID=1670831 RepID=A0A411YE31_9ACTN|nr:nucleoside hydrolase [Egibacter rhizosphaerae]QBI19489.1 nucleoside hydrolase [Egibacter rhizosphaerae]
MPHNDRTGPTPVILDCDPGHDDAVAILLAGAHPTIDLRAVTTVAGNQTLEKTTLNARRVCTVAGLDVPVAAGCDQPLAGELETAGDIHGDSGLDGPSFGTPTVPLDPRHAVDLMHELLAEAEQPLTLVGVGPLTNLATLLRRYPEDRERIERIAIMGGSTERGNRTPYAEFNIFTDPEAASEVLHSGVPTVWHGLNVTHQATATPEVLTRISELGTPLAGICVELLTFFREAYREAFGFDAPPVHDPVAIAHLIDPEAVSCAFVPMRIELDGTHTRGATVVDLASRTGWEPNAQVGLELDHARFWDHILAAVGALEPGDA